MSQNEGNDFDLLGSTIETQPSTAKESLNYEQNTASRPMTGQGPKVEKPFRGGNTLDEPVMDTIVHFTHLDSRTQHDQDQVSSHYEDQKSRRYR